MIRARATGWARLITCSAFKTFALLVHVNCMNDAVTHDTHREHGTLGINTLWPTNYCFDSKKYYRLPSSDMKTKSTRLHPLHNSKFLFKKNYWKNWFLKEFTLDYIPMPYLIQFSHLLLSIIALTAYPNSLTCGVASEGGMTPYIMASTDSQNCWIHIE